MAFRHQLATMKRTSRRRGGERPPIPRDVRALISRMSRENPPWGAPRIHGELLKPGIEVAEAAVSKYLARFPKPPSQTWRNFLGNHSKALALATFPPIHESSAYRVLCEFRICRLRASSCMDAPGVARGDPI